MSQTRSRILKGVRLAALAALGATALAVTPAWATGITWNFNVGSTFDVGNTQFSESTSCTRNGGTTYTNTALSTNLSWGCPSGSAQSSLVIQPDNGLGTAVTDGPSVPLGVTVTHNNFVVTQGHLTSTNLINSITLTPQGGLAQTPFDLTFGINFIETSNSGNCAVAPAPGSDPCPDIFVIDNTSLNKQFTYDGTTYFASIFPAAGVGGLSAAACHAAGVAAGCSGFVTQEKSASPLDFSFAITSEAIGVPEPGELGLMGLGLLGLAGLVVLRRRRATVHTRD